MNEKKIKEQLDDAARNNERKLADIGQHYESKLTDLRTKVINLTTQVTTQFHN